MNKTNVIILATTIAVLLISGCLDQTPDMKLHNYQGEVISMNLNHAMTTKFCQATGYNVADQWIIEKDDWSGVGRKVGYNLWGMDGRFNANDRRVHVDCKGTATEEKVYTIQDVGVWLNKINVSADLKLSNTTYDQFCQQVNMNFKDKDDDIVTCSRSFDVTKEYTPQEIARWYIIKGES